MSTQPDYDLAIIGSGPAGLAAATLTARQGASVVLIDEQAAPRRADLSSHYHHPRERSRSTGRRLLAWGITDRTL